MKTEVKEGSVMLLDMGERQTPERGGQKGEEIEGKIAKRCP